MTYAIISLGGKQYKVQQGERLLVDRLATDEGKTFEPRVLLVGGDGKTDLSPSTTVTARVVGHVLGEKVRIGKYKRRTGYKRHNGHRSRLTQIEIEAIGAGARKAAAKQERPAPKAAPKPEPEAAAKPEPETTGGAGLPAGYEQLKVTEINAAAPGWSKPNIEAAIEYERAHANRKTAIAALESALAAKED